MTERAWTEEEVARLRQLVEKTSFSYAKIGEMLGRTKNQVLGKARRMLFVRPSEKTVLNAIPQILRRKQKSDPTAGKPVIFCGEPIVRVSYCIDHHRRCHQSSPGPGRGAS
jgi:hypothetical protein